MSIITVVNPFEVPDVSINKAIKAWDTFETYFSQQKGYISAKLLKSLDSNGKFSLVTIAEWGSLEYFKAALANPQLEKIASIQPNFPHYPGAYEVIRGS